MFAKIAREYLDHVNARGYALCEIDAQPHSQPGERPLLSYLLLPRTTEWVKWLIMPLVFVIAAWAAGSFREWPQMLLVWLILEYLIYEARYQWNDIRGMHEDIEHPESSARRRLPGRTHAQRNVLVSSLIAALRLVVALALGAAAHLLTAVAVLIGLVFGVAILYEALRTTAAHPYLSLRPSARSIAIWLIVGAGYAIRAGTGLWLAGFHVYSLTAVTAMMYVAMLGIMFVLLIWVLEAASYCGADGKDTLYPALELAAKPHISSLLRWTGWKVENGTGSSPGAAERVIARKRTKPYAPWNLALVLGAGLGAAAVAALVRPNPGLPAYGIAAAVGITGALALVLWRSVLVRLVVTAVIGAVLVTLGLSVQHSLLVLIAAIPWLAIATGYASLSESSYQELMNFAPWLAIKSETIACKVPPLLLRLVIGRDTWQSAGFDRRNS